MSDAVEYFHDQRAEVVASHKKSLDRLLAASQTAYDQALRSLQLWSEFLSLIDPSKRLANGAVVSQKAAEKWAEALPLEVASLDATAAAMIKPNPAYDEENPEAAPQFIPMTRQDLLDQMAAEPMDPAIAAVLTEIASA